MKHIPFTSFLSYFQHFGKNFDKTFSHLDSEGQGAVSDNDLRKLFWGDFAQPSNSKKPYTEIMEFDTIITVMEEYLGEYNAQSKKPMDLVMFLFFVEHVSRVARVLKMPGGHALLVGVGGSGRQCSTRLASFMADYKLIQVELSKSYGVTEWQDDLKRILKEAGTGQQPIVFLFADTQIKWEGMIEDINNILNSGEVPNLFPMDERAEILDKVCGSASTMSRAQRVNT